MTAPQRYAFLIFAFTCFIPLVGAQDARGFLCGQFQRCFYWSPICRILHQYFLCGATIATELPTTESPITEPPITKEPPIIEPHIITPPLTEKPVRGCGFSSVTGSASEYSFPRIVGGLRAMENEFPWSVRLVDEKSKVGMCGGTIINSRTILTAAHCVSTMIERPEDLSIGYGSINMTNLMLIGTKQITVHPNYTANTNGDNDIAVVTLVDPLPLNFYLTSACLPKPSFTYHHGITCIVTGWGKMTENAHDFPEVLHKAAVPLVPLGKCQESYRSYSSLLIAERQLCAGFYQEGITDACHGDSGGPLVCAEGDAWILYGIVSTGNGCGRSRFPGIYTYVPQYISWIRSVMSAAN